MPVRQTESQKKPSVIQSIQKIFSSIINPKPNNSLHKAILSGDTEKARKIITKDSLSQYRVDHNKHKPKVHAKNKDGMTPLHLAVIENNISIVKDLIDPSKIPEVDYMYKVTTGSKTLDQNTPIPREKIKLSDNRVVTFDTDRNTRNKDQLTPLQLAFENNNRALVWEMVSVPGDLLPERMIPEDVKITTEYLKEARPSQRPANGSPSQQDEISEQIIRKTLSQLMNRTTPLTDELKRETAALGNEVAAHIRQRPALAEVVRQITAHDSQTQSTARNLGLPTPPPPERADQRPAQGRRYAHHRDEAGRQERPAPTNQRAAIRARIENRIRLPHLNAVQHHFRPARQDQDIPPPQPARQAIPVVQPLHQAPGANRIHELPLFVQQQLQQDHVARDGQDQNRPPPQPARQAIPVVQPVHQTRRAPGANRIHGRPLYFQQQQLQRDQVARNGRDRNQPPPPNRNQQQPMVRDQDQESVILTPPVSFVGSINSEAPTRGRGGR